MMRDAEQEQDSWYIVVESMMIVAAVLAKPLLHLQHFATRNQHEEKLEVIQSSVSSLVKDSTGMAFAIADGDFVEKFDEVITVGKNC